MICHLYDSSGEHVNSIIVADEEFAKSYSEENGWTYELEPEPVPPPKEIKHPPEIQAIIDRQEFLENCIAEMAQQVYGG